MSPRLALTKSSHRHIWKQITTQHHMTSSFPPSLYLYLSLFLSLSFSIFFYLFLSLRMCAFVSLSLRAKKSSVRSRATASTFNREAENQLDDVGLKTKQTDKQTKIERKKNEILIIIIMIIAGAREPMPCTTINNQMKRPSIQINWCTSSLFHWDRSSSFSIPK